MDEMGKQAVMVGSKERESHVKIELERAEKNLTMLSNVIGGLEGRLNSVLRDEPPPTEDTEKEPRVLVALAVNIRGINSTISNQVRRIEHILNRIEL